MKIMHVNDYMSNHGRDYFDDLNQAHQIARNEYLNLRDEKIDDLKSMGYSTIKTSKDKYFYRIEFYSESFDNWDNMVNINVDDEDEAAEEALNYFNDVDLFVPIDEEDMLTNRTF